MPLELAPVSIPELVGQVGRSASPAAAKQGVRIEHLRRGRAAVQADETRLQQVFDNLVSNAVKFTGAGGTVRIAASHDDSFWTIEVEDSGIGIPPAELDHIFDRFVRASNARIRRPARDGPRPVGGQGHHRAARRAGRGGEHRGQRRQVPGLPPGEPVMTSGSLATCSAQSDVHSA